MGLAIQNGALVVQVSPGSPAAQAGLQAGTQTTTINGQQVPLGGDVITAINGQPVNNMEDLISYLFFNSKVGDTVTLTINRNGQSMQVPVTLAARPAQAATQQPGATIPPTGNATQQPGGPTLGILGSTVTPQLATQLGLPTGTTGVAVAQVEPGSPAAQAGLQQGDVITSFNGSNIASIDGLIATLLTVSPNSTVPMTIIRNGQQMQLSVNFGAFNQAPPSQGLGTTVPNQQATPTPAFPTNPTPQPPSLATGLPPIPNLNPTLPNQQTPGTTTPIPNTGQTNNGVELGILGTIVTPQMITQFNLPVGTTGVFVDQVLPGSAAAQAGLQPNDVITSFNGDNIVSLNQLRQDLSNLSPNASVPLTVIRNGAQSQITVNFGSGATNSGTTNPNQPNATPVFPTNPTPQPPSLATGLPSIPNLNPTLPSQPNQATATPPLPNTVLNNNQLVLGVYGVMVTPQMITQYNLPVGTTGVYVTQVFQNSAAAQAGIQQGDVITRFNSDNIVAPDQLRQDLAQLAPNASVPMTIVRNGTRLQVTVNFTGTTNPSAPNGALPQNLVTLTPVP